MPSPLVICKSSKFRKLFWSIFTILRCLVLNVTLMVQLKGVRDHLACRGINSDYNAHFWDVFLSLLTIENASKNG